MTDFSDRQKGEERKFAMDAETAFRVAARRNRLLGHWAAEKMGLTSEETEAYAKAVDKVGMESLLKRVGFDAKAVKPAAAPAA